VPAAPLPGPDKSGAVALEQGLIDELRLHLAPMLLGGGTPLFRAGTRQMYRQREVRPSRNAVHLSYERA
jgi:riboflavin biosynthesis pyrimidine reductase